MRLIFRLVILLIVVAMLGAAALAFLIPTDYVRDQIVTLVEQKTGRMLSVKGETSFSLYPNIGVNMGDVSLSNPPGMAAGDTLQIAALNLNLNLIPLLSGRVEVDRFVLTRPVFNLFVDANGRRNWSIEKPASEDSPSPSPEATQSDDAAPMFQDLRLGDVRIVDGVLQYTDQRDGKQRRVDAINLTLALASLSEPFDAVGDFVWKDQKVAVDLGLASVLGLIERKQTELRLTVDTSELQSEFKGQVTLGDPLRVTGKTTSASRSVRKLVRWLGEDVPTASGFGEASISGNLDATPKLIAFSNMRIAFDGMGGEGEAQIRLDTARPYVKAVLRLDKVDINPYLGKGRRASAPAPSRQEPPAVAQPKGPAPKPESDQSLTDFIQDLDQQDKAPQVRGWSQAAFNFAGLRVIDADLNVTTDALLYRQIKVGRSIVAASLRSGVLTSELSEMQLYNGRGAGRITLNASQQVPALNANFSLDRVEALPLLTDSLDFNWISGRAKLAINLGGRGRSQSEMVRSLTGNGSFEFTDGAIEGLNIPQMLRGLKSGQLQGWNRADRLKTDFSQLAGTYTMQNGVARNDDLQLIGPLLRMSGSGTVDLPREWIDYTISPRVVASLEGQGGERELAGLEVPVRIIGDWSDPNFRPDLKKLLQDPDKAVESVKKLGDVVKDLKKKKNVGKLLDQFLGGDSQAESQGQAEGAGQAEGEGAVQGTENQQAGGAQQGEAQPQEKVRPKDLLNQIFR